MKRVAYILCACLVSLAANAQKVQFGVRGGLNISNESSHIYSLFHSNGQKSKVGFNVGGVVNYKLSNKFDIEADLLYSMQGFKDVVYTLELEQNINNTNYSVTSHYLNVPISLKYYIAKGFYAECGPQFGFLLSKKDKLEGRETVNSYDSGNKTFDFAVLGGLGYRFSNDVFVDARYVHGFTNTSEHYAGGKNKNIQISLGYLF